MYLVGDEEGDDREGGHERGLQHERPLPRRDLGDLPRVHIPERGADGYGGEKHGHPYALPSGRRVVVDERHADDLERPAGS